MFYLAPALSIVEFAENFNLDLTIKGYARSTQKFQDKKGLVWWKVDHGPIRASDNDKGRL